MFHNKIATNQRYIGRKSISDTQEQAMVEEYKAGVLVAELAKKYTCSTTTVMRIMKRWRVPSRNKVTFG
jgi:Mor family transcriptional regulator